MQRDLEILLVFILGNKFLRQEVFFQNIFHFKVIQC